MTLKASAKPMQRQMKTPLFSDIANEGAALNIASEIGKRIEFKRN